MTRRRGNPYSITIRGFFKEQAVVMLQFGGAFPQPAGSAAVHLLLSGTRRASALASTSIWFQEWSMEGARMQGKAGGACQWWWHQSNLWISDGSHALAYCQNLLEIEMNFCRMDFLFLPPLSSSLPISIYQFSLFCYLEHVSTDRGLQPISQCGLQ
ncbi:hypothetical protein JOB18_040731 [Solea senegalensis]|uniref:Uncharacterized protein n=1 Tax=Solea senegalensis TaxID=28829 RepID=A0AAV6Q9W5_SOLSE|nr:hypothetical protein JOB18_040731 [Solea senegalensis]